MTQLFAALRQMLPPDIGCAAGLHEDLPGELFPEETALVQNAIEKRVREFRAGRAAARTALKELGHSATAILKGPERAPLWPNGIVGSISHSNTHAATLVASHNSFEGLGIDIEPNTPVDKALGERLLRPEERENDGLAKMKFSIKEAGFKALHPQFGKFIDFHHAVTTVDENKGAFTIDILMDDWEGPSQLQGRCCIVEDHCVAVVTRPR